MAAAAELMLLEKSLGLSKGNKYSAQGERQVRRGDGVEGESWPAEPGRTGWPAEAEAGGRGPQLPRVRARAAGASGLFLQPELPDRARELPLRPPAPPQTWARPVLLLLVDCCDPVLAKRREPPSP